MDWIKPGHDTAPADGKVGEGKEPEKVRWPMGRRLVIVLDPWFGLLPDRPKAPVRFGPIQITDAAGQPMSPEAREAYLAERVYGGMSPQEIARYVERLQADLEKAKYTAQVPAWYLLVLLVAGGYVIVSAYVGEPMALWIVRGALAIYLLGWVWVIVVAVRDYLKRGGR